MWQRYSSSKSRGLRSFTHIVDLLQGQRIDPSTFPSDVELAQLTLVSLDRAGFLDRVFDAHPVKVVLDAALHRTF